MTVHPHAWRRVGWGYAALWLLMAVNPVHRPTWALEAMPLLAMPMALHHARRFPFSTRSWVQLLLFCLLHLTGSYFTYERVPVGVWVRDWLSLERNPYDRFVHGMYGFLCLLPARELFVHPAEPRWRQLLLAFSVVSTGSMLYEVVEWITARVVDATTEIPFLATQGDEWDAQKDMAMAACGSFVAALVERWVGHVRPGR